MLQEILFWFTTVTTCISGSAFLFKIPSLYRPDAYLVDGIPATGTTDFETVATFCFACVYLVPIFGLIHAHLIERTASARRSAATAPMLYHCMSTYGVLFVFSKGLNPEVAPLSTAAGMHIIYGILFAIMYYIAQDDVNKKKAH
jgi:hypothetical protein